jgi:Putative prokaryotic signal transducing protein
MLGVSFDVGIIDRVLRLFVARSDDGAPERLPSLDELVLLTRPNGEIDAQLQRQMLAGEGIHAMIKNRDPVSAESGGMGPPWAYELWVLRRDLRRARDIVGGDAG